ncbi:MAG: GNAT family N-acetyltransferase [Deltaproteobacteria bacterium]|nr:GNAT family N-acetyltransferase [Deltaproteobacteria bacterium]
MITSGLELIDLCEVHEEELLNVVYSDLYLAGFPIREEQEDPSIWRALLWGPARNETTPILHILVAGKNLCKRESRTLMGCIYAEFYGESKCGLLTYLVVHPSHRNRGLGRYLFNEAMQKLKKDAINTGGKLKAVFGEVNNPSKVKVSQDSMNPRERVRIISRLGAQRVPICYVQPELKPGQGRSRCLSLVVFPIDDKPIKSISFDTIRSFLTEFYKVQGVENPETDSDIQNMLSDSRRDLIQLESLDLK